MFIFYIIVTVPKNLNLKLKKDTIKQNNWSTLCYKNEPTFNNALMIKYIPMKAKCLLLWDISVPLELTRLHACLKCLNVNNLNLNCFLI